MNIYRRTQVPPIYRQFFFINSGGPLRGLISQKVIRKKWVLVGLDCGHQLLIPQFRLAGRLRCGFCGGFQPSSD